MRHRKQHVTGLLFGVKRNVLQHCASFISPATFRMRCTKASDAVHSRNATKLREAYVTDNESITSFAREAEATTTSRLRAITTIWTSREALRLFWGWKEWFRVICDVCCSCLGWPSGEGERTLFLEHVISSWLHHQTSIPWTRSSSWWCTTTDFGVPQWTTE